MIIKKNHPYHLVDPRPWPILGSLRAIITIIGIIKWFHLFNNNLIILGITIIFIIIFQWWRDITRERTFQGLHTFKVTLGIRWGIILFITSEVFFFISFFWGFFHRRLSPTIELGTIWPPKGIYPFNPIQIPLLNTLILLTSGITVTWAHHRLIENNFKQTLQGLGLTVILGIYFTILQGFEYIESPFSIADTVYGSTFFIATGFHGLHVIIGTTFLLICLIRHIKNHFSRIHHFGFEAAAWYWHFVDVVWLFLYISIYWWGRYLYSIKIIFNFQLKDLEII
jgi:cytochrome c oxidase subunit 3